MSSRSLRYWSTRSRDGVATWISVGMWVVVFFIGTYMGAILETPVSFQPVYWIAGYIAFVALNCVGAGAGVARGNTMRKATRCPQPGQSRTHRQDQPGGSGPQEGATIDGRTHG